MGFERPTIVEVFDRIQADFKSSVPQLDPFLPASVVFALLAAQAAAVHELNGRLAQAVRNSFVDSADLEELLRAGEIIGEPRSEGSTSLGVIDFTGTDGTEIANDVIVLDANGRRYFTAFGPVTVAGGTVQALVGSKETGADKNLPAGASVELEAPIPGIDPASGIVAALLPLFPSGFVNGADPTPVETYRAQILDLLRSPPQGGNLLDWHRWGFESVTAVDPAEGAWTRVFVVPPAAGSNVLAMYAVDDALDAAGNLITLPGAEYTAADAWIDANRRILGTDFSFAAPTLEAVDPEITLVPNTAAVQAQVTEELVQLLIREQPGPTGIGITLPLSRIDEAISRAAGETDHTLTVPAVPPTASAGAILTVGTPVFS